MNSEEKQVLHGLYYYREMVGEDFLVSANEVLWLTRTKLPKTRDWRRPDGSLNAAEEEAEDYLAKIGATSARAERPLAYLQQTGFIDYKSEHGMFRISVMANGANLARELNTRLGRLNVRYKEHRDGVIWLLLTVTISSVTSLMMSLLTAKK